MTTLASRIKILREGKALSQAELAKYIGVSQSSIGNWEAGLRTGIRGATLVKLAKALDVEPSELIDLEAGTGVEPDRSELRLLAEYRSLTEDQKQLALRLVKAIGK